MFSMLKAHRHEKSTLPLVVEVGVIVRKKRDYVGKIPKLGVGGGGGGPDPNPLLDVYLPNYFWHAKIILM